MREIIRELELPVTPGEAFALLHTPSAIRGWWSAERAVVAPRQGGLWIAAWGADEDAPEYITAARILVWDPPHRLRLGAFEYYTTAGGLPFEADLQTEFSVRPAPGGAILRVEQTGFPENPEADEFFGACQQGWVATFEGIQRFLAGANSRAQ